MLAEPCLPYRVGQPGHARGECVIRHGGGRGGGAHQWVEGGGREGG